MKKVGCGCLIICMAVFAILIVMALCTYNIISDTFSDKVIKSLGKPISKELYTSGGFQDYTDYGIYKYDGIELDSNEYFKSIIENEKEELLSYIDNFEDWIEAIKDNSPKEDIIVNYKFDRSLIDENDYFYIDDKYNYEELYKDHKYANYNVYFFDMQQQILYFFHNNI